MPSTMAINLGIPVRSNEHIAPAVTVHVLQTRYEMSTKRGAKQAHAKAWQGVHYSTKCAMRPQSHTWEPRLTNRKRLQNLSSKLMQTCDYNL